MPFTDYKAPPPSVLEIAAHEAGLYFDEPLTASHIQRKQKSRDVVERRFFAIAFMRWFDEKHFSFPVIAHRVGYRDHTSAMHAASRARDMFPDARFSQMPPRGFWGSEDLPDGVEFFSGLPCTRFGRIVGLALS